MDETGKLTSRDDKIVITILFTVLALIAFVGGLVGGIIGGNIVAHHQINSTIEPTESSENVKTWNKTSSLSGIDISEWQNDNYKQVINKEGVDFVICRAAYGMTEDALFKEAYEYAKAKEKLLGVYFYAYPNRNDPETHATFCAGLVSQELNHSETIFILDWELDSGHDNPEWALKWINKFEELTGKRPLLYTYYNYLKTANNTEKAVYDKIIENGNMLWLAYYGSNNGERCYIPDDIESVWPKNRICLHQYTNSGLGETDTLDLDVFYGNSDDWKSLATNTP